MNKTTKRIIGSLLLASLAIASIVVVEPCGGNEKDIPFIGQKNNVQQTDKRA